MKLYGKNGNYGASDWINPINEILNVLEKDSVLEFGLGNGTQYWCDNFKSVTSVELSIDPYHKEWTEQTKVNLKDYNNWSCNYIDCPKEIYQANTEAVRHKYPMTYQDHLPILKSICVPFIEKEYSLIMVDAGIHNRGDIVNLCFNYAPVIVAHDTGSQHGTIYGYNIVKCPEEYIEINKPSGHGTKFWIRKNQEQIIGALQ